MALGLQNIVGHGRLVGTAHIQEGLIEGQRVMDLEIGQLESQGWIDHRVRAVEAIAGKLIDIVVGSWRNLRFYPLLSGPPNEMLAFPRHDIGLLFTHGPS